MLPSYSDVFNEKPICGTVFEGPLVLFKTQLVVLSTSSATQLIGLSSKPIKSFGNYARTNGP